MGLLAILSFLPIVKNFRKISYNFEQPELYCDDVEIYRPLEEFLVEYPIDFLGFPESIQKRIFEKIPDHKSFIQFESTCQAVLELSEKNKDVLFTERKRAVLHVTNPSSFHQKYRCRFLYHKVRIDANCGPLLNHLLTLPVEVIYLVLNSPNISSELLSMLIQKLRLQGLVTDGTYPSDLFKTEYIGKLDRMSISGHFNDQNLLRMSSQMPRSVYLYKTDVTSAGVIAFCEEAIDGHRQLNKFRVSRSKLCSGRRVVFTLDAKRDTLRCLDHSRCRTLEKKGQFWLFIAKRRDFLIKRYECNECQKLL